MRSGPVAPEGGDPSEFVAALEAVSREIRDPVAKLRFIRGSLSRYETQDRLVRSVPWAPVRRFLYRWLSLEGLRHLFTANSLGGAVVTGSARTSLALTRALAFGL